MRGFIIGVIKRGRRLHAAANGEAMPDSHARELSLIAAGVGIGAAAVYLYQRKVKQGIGAQAPPVEIRPHAEPESQELSVKFARGRPKLQSVIETLLERAKADSSKTQAESEDSLCVDFSKASSNLAGHHLSTWQHDESLHKQWPPPKAQRHNKVVNPMALARPGLNFLNPDEKVRGGIIVNDSKASLRSHALDGGALRGNACKMIWWEPSQVKAALVTCGGLCPGLNDIIQGVTNCLWRDYGVRQIVGYTDGWNGLACPEKHEQVRSVKAAHQQAAPPSTRPLPSPRLVSV